MATATKKPRATGQLARRVREVGKSESIEFLVFEDNGGDYHWTIVAGDGATLAQSGDFGSYDEAEQAAQRVLTGAASARLGNDGVGARPVDRVARRDTPSGDSDAERWLDEGGSFSSEAVATWQARC